MVRHLWLVRVEGSMRTLEKGENLSFHRRFIMDSVWIWPFRWVWSSGSKSNKKQARRPEALYIKLCFQHCKKKKMFLYALSSCWCQNNRENHDDDDDVSSRYQSWTRPGISKCDPFIYSTVFCPPQPSSVAELGVIRNVLPPVDLTSPHCWHKYSRKHTNILRTPFCSKF